LDKFRTYRVLRYFYLNLVIRENSNYITNLKNSKYVWGGPELARFPPSQEIYSFALNNKQAILEGWRFDIQKIIDTSKENDVEIILMTYHINPTYLSITDFEDMAEKNGVYLVRNDLVFEPLIKTGEIKRYVFGNDNWHPNEKGYTLIAENVFELITTESLI
jgi:hypothetical protein